MNLSIDWNTTELLAIAGFALGLICSLFLFYVWIKYHRNRSHILLWSGGLTLFYIFLIPFIWANLGINVVLDKWTNFFIFTIPLIFLGWVLVYLGIIRVKLPLARKIPTIYYSLLFFWVLSSFFFYAIRFYSSGYQQLLSIIGIAVFFIAIHILILLALLDWIKKTSRRGSVRVKTGIIFIIVAIIISVARYLIILNDLISLPHVFWFLSVAGFDIVFILRSVVVILLAIGFVLAHKHRPSEEGA